jgi:SAM-dependent methyltransferase
VRNSREANCSGDHDEQICSDEEKFDWMMDSATFFSVPLVDLGESDIRFEGIYSPEPELRRSRRGITEQFLENAEAYHQRFIDSEYFKSLIEQALLETPLTRQAPLILDLGSGSGNSVWPCLELFPQAQIVATDLSPNLLAILRDHAASRDNDVGRLGAICMDVTQNHFSPDRFDFAIGAAILHHLIDPIAALSAVHHSLKPGAFALFFEPFENGNAILTLAYEDIVSQASSRPLREDVHVFLNRMVNDFRVRMAIRPGQPQLAELDDKWMFTKQWFERAAEVCGYSELIIKPLHELEQPFASQTRANLNMGLGLPPDVLPDWAWAIIDRIDQAFSQDLRADLLIEGRVMMRK